MVLDWLSGGKEEGEAIELEHDRFEELLTVTGEVELSTELTILGESRLHDESVYCGDDSEFVDYMDRVPQYEGVSMVDNIHDYDTPSVTFYETEEGYRYEASIECRGYNDTGRATVFMGELRFEAEIDEVGLVSGLL
ncbi:MAG: hypothetical protein SVU32_08820 [Candidatus Nanohaloarchaea archaeon]|nr:hypothetical protein [Candidatus Nanohaloarchaea archaeon]